MRTIQLLALATLASVTAAASAVADERVHLTPPLFREQARVTASVRPASGVRVDHYSPSDSRGSGEP